jgi:ABC-2 type transport system permease protein
MRLLNILISDMKAFFRDIRSFFLLFITPLFIVMLVGIAFIGAAPSNIKITVCSVEDNEVSRYFSGNIEDSKMFKMKEVSAPDVDQCRQVIYNDIKTSSALAGVVIPGIKEFSTVHVELIVDNSNIMSDYIVNYFKIVSNDISQKIVKGYVDMLFTNIDQVNTNIDQVEQTVTGERQRLYTFRNNLISVKESLNQLKVDLNTLSANERSSSGLIDDSTARIDLVLSGLNSVDSGIWASNASAAEKNGISSQISTIKSSLQSVKTNLANTRQNIVNSQFLLSNGRLSPMQINSIIATINNTLAGLDTSISSMNSAISSISSFKALVSTANRNRPESVQVVSAEIKNVFSQKLIDFIFPNIVMMVIMVISTFLAAITFIRQRSTGLAKRISLAPNGIRFMLMERLILTALLSMTPVPIILIAGKILLDVELSAYVIVLIFAIGLLTAILFSAVGMIIASISKYESTAILLSILIVLPMIFLAGILIPLEKLPPVVYSITSSMPLNVIISLFGNLYFYSLEFAKLAGLSVMILVYFAVFVTVAWFMLRRDIIK